MYDNLMTFFYNFGLVSFKKIAVRMALHNVESEIARDIIFNQEVYRPCDYCTWPLLPGDEHPMCDIELAFLEEDPWDSLCLQDGCWEEPVRAGYCQKCWDYNYLCAGCGKLEEECRGDCYLEKKCDVPGCYNDKVKEDLCQEHWDHYFLCQACGQDNRKCLEDHPDEMFDDDPSEDYDPRDDEDFCDCGEPTYACVCAELASLRSYNATPLEERCGPWTA